MVATFAAFEVVRVTTDLVEFRPGEVVEFYNEVLPDGGLRVGVPAAALEVVLPRGYPWTGGGAWSVEERRFGIGMDDYTEQVIRPLVEAALGPWPRLVPVKPGSDVLRVLHRRRRWQAAIVQARVIHNGSTHGGGRVVPSS